MHKAPDARKMLTPEIFKRDVALPGTCKTLQARRPVTGPSCASSQKPKPQHRESPFNLKTPSPNTSVPSMQGSTDLLLKSTLGIISSGFGRLPC